MMVHPPAAVPLTVSQRAFSLSFRDVLRSFRASGTMTSPATATSSTVNVVFSVLAFMESKIVLQAELAGCQGSGWTKQRIQGVS